MTKIKKLVIGLINWFAENIPLIPRKLTACIARLLPLRNTILLESKPPFTDNTVAVYEELLRRGYNKKYKLIWIAHSETDKTDLPENVSVLNLRRSYFTYNISGRWTIARAKYIIDCNGYVHKTNRRSTRIHLTHGLPIKSVPWYNQKVGAVELLCVSAEYWVKESAQNYLVPQQIVKPLGFPRNDILMHPVLHERKSLIWMPTYRVHGGMLASHVRESALYREKMPFGLPCVQSIADLQELNDLAASFDADLYIRLHPAQDVSGINLHDLSNICVCDNAYLQQRDISLYFMLRETDALITDYSSIYYDYLLLDKPIAMVVSDFEDYSQNNGLLEDTLEKYMQAHPAVYVQSLAELKQFMRNVLDGKDTAREQRQAAKEKYMGAQTDHAAANVVDYMEQHFGL